jgi:hypothetical protein
MAKQLSAWWVVAAVVLATTIALLVMFINNLAIQVPHVPSSNASYPSSALTTTKPVTPSVNDSTAGGNSTSTTGTCGSCSAEAGGAALLPVNDPNHNLREIVKQMLLLEDHLFQVDKQCRMCIAKHMFAIEALAEEAITLDQNHREHTEVCSLMVDIAREIRTYHEEFKNTQDPDEITAIAQKVREMRRQLMAITEKSVAPGQHV